MMLTPMPAMSGFASLIVLQVMLHRMLSRYIQLMESVLVQEDSKNGTDCINDGFDCAENSRSGREERS